MANKQEIFGGVFRGLLTGGAWMRLTLWAKQREDRAIDVAIHYTKEGTKFAIVMVEGGTEVFKGEGTGLDGLIAQAVLHLGKAF